MKLLHTKDFRLVADSDAEFKTDPRYASLSHRSLQGETQSLNFHEQDILDECSPVLEKIRGVCRRASNDGFIWIWIDSVCIDKTNAVELSRANNSMFKW